MRAAERLKNKLETSSAEAADKLEAQTREAERAKKNLAEAKRIAEDGYRTKGDSVGLMVAKIRAELEVAVILHHC